MRWDIQFWVPDLIPKTILLSPFSCGNFCRNSWLHLSVPLTRFDCVTVWPVYCTRFPIGFTWIKGIRMWSIVRIISFWTIVGFGKGYDGVFSLYSINCKFDTLSLAVWAAPFSISLVTEGRKPEVSFFDNIIRYGIRLGESSGGISISTQLTHNSFKPFSKFHWRSIGFNNAHNGLIPYAKFCQEKPGDGERGLL